MAALCAAKVMIKAYSDGTLKVSSPLSDEMIKDLKAFDENVSVYLQINGARKKS